MYSSFGYDFFGFRGSAVVQNLLNKPDLTLNELLEEDGLSAEIKTYNKRLTDFLTTNSNFKDLIKYVITESTAEEAELNKKKSFKYPFICADILSSESKNIIGAFFTKSSEIRSLGDKSTNVEYISNTTSKAVDSKPESNDEVKLDDSVESIESQNDENDENDDKENKAQATSVTIANDNYEYLDYLFTFLDEPEMNFTAAGYFAKVVNNLLAKRSGSLLAYLYEERPALLEKLINHVSSKSVAEFLSKVLSFESSQLDDSTNPVYDSERMKALNMIIKKLDSKNDVETINNSAFLICEIFGKYNTMHNGYEILGSLLDTETINYLFSILQAKDSTSSCAVGLILGNVFAYYILMNAPKYDEYGQLVSNPDDKPDLHDDIPLFKAMIENIPSIISYLGSTEGSSFNNQHGAAVVPLGGARLKLIELLIIAIKTNNSSICAKLAQCELIETLLNLMLKYEFNNMLHNQVEKIVLLALESGNEDLKVALFERADILNFIVRASRQSDHTLPGKHERKVRKGYMAQIVKISNRLSESQDDYVLTQMEKSTQWREYVETQLMETNTKYSVNFGGRDPRDPRGDYDESDDGHNESDETGTGLYSTQDENNQDEQEAHDEADNDDLEVLDQEEGFREDFDDEEPENVEEEQNQEKENNSEFYSTLNSTKLAEEMLIFQNMAEEAHEEQGDKSMGIIDIGQTLVEEEGVTEYNPNVYFKRESQHSVEDVLKEIELF